MEELVCDFKFDFAGFRIPIDIVFKTYCISNNIQYSTERFAYICFAIVVMANRKHDIAQAVSVFKLNIVYRCKSLSSALFFFCKQIVHQSFNQTCQLTDSRCKPFTYLRTFNNDIARSYIYISALGFDSVVKININLFVF